MIPYVDADVSTALDSASRDTGEWEVNSIISHEGSTLRNLKFKIRWTGFDASEDSDLPYHMVKDLKALDDYLVGHPALRRLLEKKKVTGKGQ